MKKKNVLLITPFAPPNIGGAEAHLHDYYTYLTEHGYNVTLLTYQPLTSNVKGKGFERKKNLTIYRYQWIGFNLFPRFEKYPPIFNFLYLTPYLLVRSFLYMVAHHKEVDLIHVFGLNAAFIARILNFFFKKDLYISMEALYGFNSKNIFGKVCHWVLKEFNAVLVGSDDSKKDVANLGISNTSIIVYIHWIDLALFTPKNKEDSKKKLHWKNEFTALYLGRLIPQKGIMVFLEAAKKAHKNIQFKIIGDGSEIGRVENAVKSHSNIQYLGKVAHDDIAPYYAAADVLIYPALYDEDLSLVLLESLASGTPVINTNKGSGVYELNDSFSFVVKPDPIIIAQKVDYLYKNPKKLSQMAKKGVSFAQQFGPQLAHIISDTYESHQKNKS